MAEVIEFKQKHKVPDPFYKTLLEECADWPQTAIEEAAIALKDIIERHPDSALDVTLYGTFTLEQIEANRSSLEAVKNDFRQKFDILMMEYVTRVFYDIAYKHGIVCS